MHGSLHNEVDQSPTVCPLCTRDHVRIDWAVTAVESKEEMQLAPSGVMLHKLPLSCTVKSAVYGVKAEDEHAYAPDQHPIQDHHAQLCGFQGHASQSLG